MNVDLQHGPRRSSLSQGVLLCSLPAPIPPLFWLDDLCTWWSDFLLCIDHSPMSACSPMLSITHVILPYFPHPTPCPSTFSASMSEAGRDNPFCFTLHYVGLSCLGQMQIKWPVPTKWPASNGGRHVTVTSNESGRVRAVQKMERMDPVGVMPSKTEQLSKLSLSISRGSVWLWSIQKKNCFVNTWNSVFVSRNNERTFLMGNVIIYI